MLLHVLHETRYDYRPAVHGAHHMAHLKPREGDGQRLRSHALRIDPAPAQVSESRDAFGNTRAVFALHGVHAGLRVVADSVVDTAPAAPPPRDMPWEAAARAMRPDRTGPWDPAMQFLFASPYVPLDQAFVDYARPSFVPGRGLVAAARELATRIHRDFAYQVEATDASTPALAALALRKGVCQDFAHVMLACLRSLGLPARYVSGYLLTQPPPGQTRLVGSDASHAWAALYVPPGDGAPGLWTGLDPTNDRAPGEDYVVLAHGRDYADVAPLRGVLEGGAEHVLHVGVTVTTIPDLSMEPS